MLMKGTSYSFYVNFDSKVNAGVSGQGVIPDTPFVISTKTLTDLPKI